jgi:DNA-binding LytR/AlgR family response regulator
VVRTRDQEYLIKKTIKELAAELSHEQFWQIHRATLVNLACIDMVSRTFTGGYEIRLKDLHETLAVSRTYSHKFKQM